MTSGAMQYTGDITKSARLKYWTVVNASTVCINTCEKVE